MSMNAIGPAEVDRRRSHVANSVSFLSGGVQSATTVPVRALVLRRMAPDDSPSLSRTLVADAPVLALEGTVMGAALVAATLISGALPLWSAALALGLGVAGLVVLVALRDRFRDRGAIAGLRVLSDPRRRSRLVALAVIMCALGLTRAWMVLAGFDLPHGFASAAVLLAVLGVLGALPIGPTSTPAASLAVFGATNASAAAGAGIAMVATSLTATLIYVGLALIVLRLPVRRPRFARAQPGSRERIAPASEEAASLPACQASPSTL